MIVLPFVATTLKDKPCIPSALEPAENNTGHSSIPNASSTVIVKY
jgi:hypothetical protein